jgi:outer membrane protein assembly factor BamB
MTHSAGWKLVWVFVLATAAAVAPACATRKRPDWHALLLREARMPPDQRRALLHASLRANREPHDIYINVMALADETTVPLLLERFRIDHPMAAPKPEPEPAPEPTRVDSFPYSIGPVGHAVNRSTRYIPAFSCVQGHLVDALSYATNTNRGMYFPDWKAWWDENQHKSRREWIAQGFKEAGLSPSDPIDEQFGLDLIGLLAQPRGHLPINARRLLETVSAADRLAWIEKAARSDQNARRLGAISALRDLHPAGHEDLLRTLTADTDAEVRVSALSTLNARLRQRLNRQKRLVRVNGRYEPLSYAPLAVTDDLIVTAGNHGIEAFDARSGRRRWRNPSMGGRLAIVNGRVMAATNGQLVGFNPQGTVAWRVLAGGDERDRDRERVRRLFAIGDHLGVLRAGRLEWRDPDTGLVVHAVADRTIPDADATGRTVYALVNDQLQKMVDGRVLARRDVPRGIGVSVRDNTVCVLRRTGGEMTPSAEVACYDAESLAPRWARPAPSPGTGGHDVAPVQSASHVYVRSKRHLSAFRRDDGAPLWADRAGQEVFGTLMVTPLGLFAAGPDSRLELRALDSGEVLEIWPDKPNNPAVSPSGRVAAFVAADGSLRILPARPAPAR